ncbi:MAG: sirohydrochlorin chelatase [Planctomycetes bacterium]|nr:sirohydrochlorin chelatase [Planctomycetota bacterium]
MPVAISNSPHNEHRGVLLVGHGTRHEKGRGEFLETAKLVASRLRTEIVRSCFLELAEPNMREGISQLVHDGAESIVVVPVFLFAAQHWKRDIPNEIKAAQRTHPNLQIRMARHLGDHQAVMQLSLQRFEEAMARTEDSFAKTETATLMVGRGGSDQTAINEMLVFARQRESLSPVAQHATCFLAKARPTVAEAFESLRNSSHQLVVVQPHILFHGELIDDLRTRVEEMDNAASTQRWVTTDPLGFSNLLVTALVARFRETRFDSIN